LGGRKQEVDKVDSVEKVDKGIRRLDVCFLGIREQGLIS
jgi:hypothetical protein